MIPRLHTLAFEYDEHAPGGFDDSTAYTANEDPGQVDVDQADGQEQAGGFDYESPEFRQAAADAAREQFGQLLHEALAFEQQEGQYDDLDPVTDPDGYRAAIEQAIEARVQAAIAPMLPTVEHFQNAQTQEQIDQMVGRIPAVMEASQFLPEETEINVGRLTEFMANGFMPDTEARYGQNERAVEAALRMAATEFSAALKAAHQAGYQARTAELQGLSGARQPVHEPGSVEAVQVHDADISLAEAAERWAARNGSE